MKTYISRKNSNQGFALIFVMLVLASILVGVSFAAGIAGTFSGNRMKLYDGAAQTRMVANACAENLLMQLRSNVNFSGSGTMSMLDGSCTYVVSGTIPAKIISITAVRNNIYKRLTITTTQLNPTILSTWTEKAI